MPGIPRCATLVGASMSLRVGEPTTCPIMATVVLYLRGRAASAPGYGDADTLLPSLQIFLGQPGEQDQPHQDQGGQSVASAERLPRVPTQAGHDQRANNHRHGHQT